MVLLRKHQLLASAFILCSSMHASDGLMLFETKVRPVLAQECYACHTKARVAGLRLDTREDMLKGGATGPAIVPGKPDESLLIKALRHQGDLQMPKGRKLKPEQIEAVEEWVRLGAPWPEAKSAAKPASGDKFALTPEQRNFWAFQPLKKTAPPAAKDAKASKNWIDNFILARLSSEGIQPVPQADKRTLIRRATYDLTGLPPTPEEVDAFLADASPEAFPKLVDRLLASPAYGERWGRHWLDVARYAEDDTRGLAPMGKGHEPYKFAYIYRDWVIRAMNDDMPYDQFVKAQIAADKLDEKLRVKMLPALGFLGQGPWYYDLADPPVARADERHERVDVITRGFLGLTVACARCHDHKYDPISMHDYYGIASVVNKTEYHEYPLVPKKIHDAWTAEDKKLKAVEKSLGEFTRTASTMLADVLARQSSVYMMAAWKVTGPDKADPARVAAEQKLDLEALQRWIRFLAKPPAFYPYLKPWQAMIAAKGKESDAKKLADEFQTLILDVAAERSVIKRKNERMLASVPDEDEIKSIPLPNGFKSFFDRHQLELKTLERERMNLWTDVFQRDMSDMDDPMEMDPRKLRPGLLVFRDWGLQRQISPEWRAYMAGVKEEIEKRRKAMGQFPFVHGVRDMEEMSDLKVHLRGSPYNLGDTAPARFIEVLSKDKPAPFTAGSGRIELANDIARHPLTARVIVNRVWKWHFGTGLVDTPSNFGFAGERPSHPELLDNLASFFNDNGMSMKKLHREIMLSATYQRGYAHSEAAAAKDGANRLYWRANRQRLDAESIRDSMLSYSGVVDTKMYGPSEELTEASKRRTVYGKVSRFKLDNYLALFDFPNPNLTAENRHSTNVPLQGLFFLNSKFVLNQAEALAKKLAVERKDEAKIRQAYRVLFQRAATDAEIKAGLEFLKEEREKAPKEGEPAEKVISQKAPAGCDTMQSASMATPMAAKPAAPATASDCLPAMEEKPRADPAKPAADKDKPKAKVPDAWTTYCKVLLSSNELLYVD